MSLNDSAVFSKSKRSWLDLFKPSKNKSASTASGAATKNTSTPDKAAAKPAFKVNPIINAMLRIFGEWPLTGPVPVGESTYKRLFDALPSFVDFFPIVDFDDNDGVYLLDDGINVAGIWKVHPKYMAGRSEAALDTFNLNLTRAINMLPAVEDPRLQPYVVQCYVINEGANSIGDDLETAIAARGLLNDPYSQEILRVNREHAELLSHEYGAFPDSRLNDRKGWRIGGQQVYLCIYTNRSKRFWKQNKRSPSEQLLYDLSGFFTVMRASGVRLDVLKPHQLIAWLGPFFGSSIADEQTVSAWRQTAGFDIGQKIFAHQPFYHHSDDLREQGIWYFNDQWMRYLTIGGIDRPPRDGEVTLGQSLLQKSAQSQQSNPHEKRDIGASMFEQLPGCMMTYTLVPQPDHMMKNEINRILSEAENTGSRQANYTREQGEEVNEEMMRNKQRVYYVQLGLYLKSHSLQGLQDATDEAMAIINASGCMEVINPRYDLISQDSFVRALPGVYDFVFDRKASLRARKVYTSHLASLLPFFGNKSGSDNPCYIMYSRSGDPFYLNPFHPNDRERVSHELFFGPSGSGKSASICYMAMQSMAVNNPRMFIFDYGKSFALMADYMERYGKKVKRFVLNRHSKDVVAPFFETRKAYAEHEMAEKISAGEWVDKYLESGTEEGSDDEERSYLAEMATILEIMITGGNERVLSQSERKYLMDALVGGLKLSIDAGEPHARPVHMAASMRALADKEAANPNRIEKVAINLREMADALELWTKGERGMLFNRIAEGFSAQYDLTLIELGALGKQGSEDMLAVAALSAIFTITALAEKLQNSGRAIEVKVDEMHLQAKIAKLMEGWVVGSKVFRKLGCWLTLITQDISDFKGIGKKLLGNAEFWWLMQMDEKEIREAETVLNLSDEIKHLIRMPQKEDRRFTEGISKSAKFPDTLVRFIPPSLMLALAQTDKTEKARRHELMQANEGMSELDAALMVAQEIQEQRRLYQQQAD